MRELTRAEGPPSESVAVGVGGEIVWAEGFGWADIESEVPITPETRFRVGSTAKHPSCVQVGHAVAYA